MAIILELLLELLLQIAGELSVDFTLRSLGEPFAAREKRNAFLAGVGYSLMGIMLGFVSLLIFPETFIKSEPFHGFGLLVTPVLAGLVMSAVGWLRERQGQSLLRLDSFLYGFLFAFMMALVRFVYTT